VLLHEERREPGGSMTKAALAAADGHTARAPA